MHHAIIRELDFGPVGLPVMDARVLRGGSWINNQDNARCAFRNRNHPNNWNNDNGFRLLSLSHTSGIRLGPSWPWPLGERAHWPTRPARAVLPEVPADHGLQAEAADPRWRG